MSTLYHANGALAWNGSAAYHANGQLAGSGLVDIEVELGEGIRMSVGSSGFRLYVYGTLVVSK